MTRPNKHAARFGARYQPPIDWRRLTKAMPDILAVMRRVTEAFRQAADNMRRAREMEQTARQVEAVFSAGTLRVGDTVQFEASGEFAHFWHQPPEVGSTVGRMGGRIGPPSDILDRIDNTLLTYDSQHADGTEPWPYRGF